MKSIIRLEENNVVFEFESEIMHKYKFSLEKSINFTEWIIELSNLNERLEVLPMTYDAFIVENNDCDDKIKKVIEYLYKIVNAYSECYNRVFYDGREIIKEAK